MKISIVIPVYNSEKTIAKLVDQLFLTLVNYSIEIILVNDASKDNSELICKEIAGKRKEVKFISLRINSGEHNAVICGLNFCEGNYVAIIDDDFQNPPSEIITLLNKAIQGDFDVVYSKYEVKQHSFTRNLYSKINDFFATHILNKPAGLYLSSFKVLKKEIIPNIVSYTGPYPYIDALILRITNNIGVETVLHENRLDGKSNYTFKKLFSLYLNMLVNFSNMPLRLVSLAGFLTSGFSFLGCLIIFYEELFISDVTVNKIILMIILFTTGISFLCIGLMGEYIGKILMTINSSPQYTIKSKINID